MPSYVVRKRASSRDGSALGNSGLTVRATSEREAKESAAETLGVSIQHLEATQVPDPWS